MARGSGSPSIAARTSGASRARRLNASTALWNSEPHAVSTSPAFQSRVMARVLRPLRRVCSASKYEIRGQVAATRTSETLNVAGAMGDLLPQQQEQVVVLRRGVDQALGVHRLGDRLELGPGVLGRRLGLRHLLDESLGERLRRRAHPPGELGHDVLPDALSSSVDRFERPFGSGGGSSVSRGRSRGCWRNRSRRWCEAITSASATGRSVPRGDSISRSPDRAMPTTPCRASSRAYCSKLILSARTSRARASPGRGNTRPLAPDLERPALLVGDQEAVVGRLVVLQQAPQRGRGREADVGHEQTRPS